MNIAPYRKLVAAVVAGVAQLGVAAADATITTSEAITIALAVAGALGVYQATNAER